MDRLDPKLRVLHVGSGNLYGGVESFLAVLARFRAACPYMEQHFALCFPGRIAAEIEALGAPVHMVTPVRVSRPWTVMRGRRRLSELARDGAFDVVVCHMAWAMAIFGRAARRTGAKVVFWQHNASDGRHWLERWARLTRPDLCVYNSRFSASLAHGRASKVPAEVIYCPVPPGQPEPGARAAVRAELNTPEDHVVVVQVSRMEPWKGHRTHLAALSKLRDLRGWTAWFAGGAQTSGERRYLAGLRQLAARYSIGGRVRFLGQRRDVPRVLAAADIFCQPNTEPEPFGISFVEALAAGLPAIGTRLGGAREIITAECGRLAPADKPMALETALRELILDSRLRAALGQAGPRRARELCAPEARIRQLYDVLASLEKP